MWKGAHNWYLEDTFAIALKNGVSRDAEKMVETHKCPYPLNKPRYFAQ
jgi:hypothetical protein